VSDERGLRIRLLGNLAASYDGVAVDLGGPQQRAVLAMLVLYRDQGLSDDRIVEYLWDDQPPARALPTLQAYISHLRRRLEPQAAAGSRSGVIVRQGRGVCGSAAGRRGGRMAVRAAVGPGERRRREGPPPH
jgi:DNA-binding SARP family transcriptional activator